LAASRLESPTFFPAWGLATKVWQWAQNALWEGVGLLQFGQSMIAFLGYGLFNQIK
jgi:hypothetical protein